MCMEWGERVQVGDKRRKEFEKVSAPSESTLLSVPTMAMAVLHKQLLCVADFKVHSPLSSRTASFVPVHFQMSGKKMQIHNLKSIMIQVQCMPK